MFKLTTPVDTLQSSALPARLLREISSCTYRTIGTLHFDRSMVERTSTNGLLGAMLSESYNHNLSTYATRPKTKEEAAIRGERNYDALQVSISGLVVDGLHQTVSGTLAPLRYSVLDEYKALRERLLGNHDAAGLEALYLQNPMVVGSAVYIVAEHEGEPHIFMQIKGNAKGASQIHSAAVAGGASMEEFEQASSPKEMFDQAAIRQAKEEIGLVLKPEQLGAPSLFRTEDATGNAGVGYIIRTLEGQEILDAYTQHVQGKKIGSSDDSAGGLVLLPLSGTREVLFDYDNPSLAGAKEFHVTRHGAELTSPKTPRMLRPAAQGFLAALSSDEHFYRKVLLG